MSETTAFTLTTAQGRTLHGLVDLPGEPGPRPAVVVCHGFKGFMEWGFFPHLAATLAASGFVAVRFNLSGSGMRPGDELVSDPAAFRDNTYSREVEDLLAVLGAVGASIAPGRVDPGRLGLVGHSRGGGNAVLAAARPEWRDRIGALVTWAALAHVDRFTPEKKAEWRRLGEAPVVNARTGQQLAMGLPMLADVEDHGDALDIEAAAAVRTAPWLIVHGENDESVPAEEGRILAQVARGETELLLIPGTDHTFGSRHPFAGSTPALIEAVSATRLWLHRHLVAA